MDPGLEHKTVSERVSEFDLDVIHHVTAWSADPAAFAQPEVDSEGNAYVDMYFIGDIAKLITGQAVPPGCFARLRTYTTVDVKRA
eukprot:12416350-Karenia_brevis.AAC.1